MADHTITISNSLNLFGGSPSSLWNAYNWGSFKWGEGTVSVVWDLDHLISNTLTFSTVVIKDSEKVISNTLTVVSEMTYESVQDANGYYYVYVPNVTNAESRTTATYTSGSVSAASWTSQAASATVWS